MSEPVSQAKDNATYVLSLCVCVCCVLCVCVCVCVYTGELIAHRERLSRHIQGTNAEVTKYKSNSGTLNNQLQSKVSCA